MKTLTILFMLIAGVSYSQVGQAESIPEGNLIGVANRTVGLPKLESHIVEGEQAFLLFYYNLEYPSLKEVESIAFFGSDQDLDHLYNFLKTQLDSKETKSLKLGESEIFATKISSSVKVDVFDESGLTKWFYLTRKQLDRLFNKA